MEINIGSLPNKQRLIFTISNEEELYENYNLNKDLVKIIKHKQHFNIYRYDKYLDPKIKAFDFMYYYKNIYNRSKLLDKKIDLLSKFNEDDWEETLNINDKIHTIKVLANDFQIIMYRIEDTHELFELFNLKIRKHDNKYMLRLEMGFNILNMVQEIQFKEQIQLLNDFEKIILNQN
jgi:hypothetical protein